MSTSESLSTQLARMEHRVRELEEALERERELKEQAFRRAVLAEEGQRRAWRVAAKTSDRVIRPS